MSPVKIGIYTVGSVAAGSIVAAAGRLAKDHPGLAQVIVRTSEGLCGPGDVLRVLEELGQCGWVIVILHGGKSSCEFFDELMEATQGCWRYIHPSDDEELALSRRFSSDPGGALYEQSVRYIAYGGVDNWYNLLLGICKAAGKPLQPSPPRPQPCQGMYHPRLGVVDTLEEYLAGLGIDPPRLAQAPGVVGLWIGQHQVLENNLEPIDAALREIEAQGGVGLCCFYRRYPDPRLDVKGTRWVVDNYFKYQGKVVVDVVISPMVFSLKMLGEAELEAMRSLGVVVLEAIQLFSPASQWQANPQGLNPMELSICVAQPEFDGVVVGVPVAGRELTEADPTTGAMVPRLKPIPERLGKVVRLAMNWARLRRKPNAQKRVAIIFHNYPPRADRIGCAAGLDSFASVAGLLKRLKAEGYHVQQLYEPQQLAETLVKALNNDWRFADFQALAARALEKVGAREWKGWRDELPPEAREGLEGAWGEAPGQVMRSGDEVLVGGIVSGNIFIGVQPSRGLVDNPEKIHDPDTPPSWHYLFFYRWLRDCFGADAVVHVGKHGSLEWLPGKGVGLDRQSYPDLAIMELPNIYPYIVNDPGEGTQAKRRSYCALVDHLIPVMTNAGLYGVLAEVDRALTDYRQSLQLNPAGEEPARQRLWEVVERAGLHQDLGVDRAQAMEDFPAFVQKLHSYLSECADTAIADGLHVLGNPPEGKALVELATQMVRLGPKGGGLREVVARAWGLDYEEMLSSPHAPEPSGRWPTYAKALEAVHEQALTLVQAVAAGHSPALEGAGAELEEVLGLVREQVLPGIRGAKEEIEAVVKALSGGHVPSGPSGAPTRGALDILPTGRNFYSVDPQRIPTPAAWDRGVAMGEDLVRRHRADHGRPPDSVGMVLWASPTMRTQGEDVAEALYLMGMKPVWEEGSGRVVGVQPIPLEELKFPRVDVTLRTSGMFRDAFPNLMELLDEAVVMAAGLNEPPEYNFLRRNVLADAREFEARGMNPQEALREATLRVFSDAPGTYGAGVGAAIDAKAWENHEDLGKVWVRWGGYAYGEGVWGRESFETFTHRLSRVTTVVKNEDSREYDLMSSDDFNAYFGGFIAAVRMASGRMPAAYSCDGADPNHLRHRSLREETCHILRARILNPKWIEGLKRHGFKGAADLARAVEIAFHWDATSDVIEPWMYQALAEHYALDAQMREWMARTNPHALEALAERLLEAVARGMWKAEQATVEQLKQVLLDVEGTLEEAGEN